MPGEHEQERLEEVEEVGTDVLVVLLREVGTGDRLDTLREHRPDVRDELVLAHAGVGRDVDLRDLRVVGHEELLRLAEGEARERHRPEAVFVRRT